jgi:hypothetical protein
MGAARAKQASANIRQPLRNERKPLIANLLCAPGYHSPLAESTADWLVCNENEARILLETAKRCCPEAIADVEQAIRLAHRG